MGLEIIICDLKNISEILEEKGLYTLTITALQHYLNL